MQQDCFSSLNQSNQWFLTFSLISYPDLLWRAKAQEIWSNPIIQFFTPNSRWSWYNIDINYNSILGLVPSFSLCTKSQIAYPYAVFVSLLEKRQGVRMHVRMLKRKLKNRPGKLRPVRRCFPLNSSLSHAVHSLSWILFTHLKPVKYECVNYVKFERQWKSTFISLFLSTKLRNMQHQIFSHKLLLKKKT